MTDMQHLKGYKMHINETEKGGTPKTHGENPKPLKTRRKPHKMQLKGNFQRDARENVLPSLFFCLRMTQR